jgi:hypothetical protein
MRNAEGRTTMPEVTPYKLHVATNRDAVYASGVADGEECRRRKGKPSIFLLVARDDDYSVGFRAGFFQRALLKPVIAVAAEKIEHDELQGREYGKGSS